MSYASDAEATRLMFYGPWDDTETRAYLARMVAIQREKPRRTWELAVVERESGVLIGACDLTLETEREADLGYILARQWWGRGYATEAASAMVHAGFEELALDRVFAMCEVSHDASRRVMEKAGLRQTRLVNAAKRVRGRWWDMWLYERLRSDWNGEAGRT